MAQERQPLDGGYGWIVMMASFSVQFLWIGIRIGSSMLMIEYSQTFGASMSKIGMTVAVYVGIANLSGFLMGSLVDKFGARRVCMLGSVVAAIGLFTTAFVPNVDMVFLTYGVITGLGDGAMFTSSSVIVQQYFDKKRAFAAGVTTVGIGVGASITGLVYAQLIGHFGWRGTLILHSGFILHGVVLGAFYRPLPRIKSPTKVKDELPMTPLFGSRSTNGIAQNVQPAAVASRTTKIMKHLCDPRVVKDPTFLLYAIGAGLFYYTIVSHYQFIPSWGISIGLSKDQVGWLLTALGLTTTVSRLLTSFLANLPCTNRTLLVAVSAVLTGISVLSFISIEDFQMAALGCGFFSAVTGTFLCIMNTVLVDLLGRNTIAKAQGWLYTAKGIGAMLSLPVEGWLFDTTGSYTVPFIVAAIVQLLSAICIFTLFIRSRRCCRGKSTQAPAECQTLEVSL